MHELFLIIGTIGAIAFALSGLPQAVKSWRDGHSNGIAHGTVWLWMIGEVSMITYAIYFYPNDLVLIANYTVNLILVSIIFKYKYWNKVKE